MSDAASIATGGLNPQAGPGLAEPADPQARELAPMFDIPLRISIEVGRVRLTVRDLLRLVPGSIIELKKPAGEPFDICINRVQMARGEVIMVEQSSGVRIVEVYKTPGSTGAKIL